MDELELTQESALSLTLEGSLGSFKVGTGQEGQNSLEVKYFLTHVGLDFSGGSSEALLKHLSPVREIFTFKDLDFDEIMQRDIDDARVSSELIPYLLDEKSKDLIKLFPPIVVVVLPVREDENRPADKYPKINEFDFDLDEKPIGRKIIRSGDPGQEVFEFEQPIFKTGKLLEHDKVRLRLNTEKTKLVIVDGQHRAMALLALYRNLKNQWSHSERAPFKEYYSEWTTSYINSFNLKEINLPIILCTFPDLDDSYEGEYSLKEACRSIFLTLNKTARKVSESRNKLLDDNDLIAYFLRACLSVIKKIDARSPYSLRISNVELDQYADKVKIQSPIALTGVSHVYYIIEHIMLNRQEDVNGCYPRSGKYYKRTDLNTYPCMSRLNGRDILGAVSADSTTRDNFKKSNANALRNVFLDCFGSYIIKTLQLFKPYEAHNKAVLDLEKLIEVHEDRTLRPILFEGQGIGRIFETHRKNLKDKLENGSFKTDVSEIESIKSRLDATSQRIANTISQFKVERGSYYISEISDKTKLKVDGNIHEKLMLWITELYENVLTTVAFQTGMIAGFFGEYEKSNSACEKLGCSSPIREECFTEYLDQLNEFFIPRTSSKLRKLVAVFSGKLEGDINQWKLIKTKQTFRSVVYRGEMQPDQWPKYKYLFLEIWNPSDENLNKSVVNEREKCRIQIFSSLYDSVKKAYCVSKQKSEEDLTKKELSTVFKESYESYSILLKTIGSGELDKEEMKCAVSIVHTDEADKVDDIEVWASINGEE